MRMLHAIWQLAGRPVMGLIGEDGTLADVVNTPVVLKAGSRVLLILRPEIEPLPVTDRVMPRWINAANPTSRYVLSRTYRYG